VLSISLDVSLGQSKIKDKNFIGSFVKSNAEIVRLDVPVNEVPIMHILDPGDHLINEHENCLK
jgi:hypothetical protein